jgi:hypothetical protein
MKSSLNTFSKYVPWDFVYFIDPDIPLQQQQFSYIHKSLLTVLI